MGVRINVVMDHQIGEWDNATFVMATMASALNALKNVEDYWRKNDPSEISAGTWVNKSMGFSFSSMNLQGPGAIRLTITPKIAWIHTGGRWSGFMTIPELRKVHLSAFKAIANCLGATFAAYFADCDDVYNLLAEQSPPQAIETILKKHYGDPRTDVENIDERAVQKRPTVWYLEKVKLQV